MAHKLFNFGLAWAFVLGCWGGVLASAVCPHLGCGAEAAAPAGGRGHDAHAASETHEPAAPQDHCARAQSHAEGGRADAAQHGSEAEASRGSISAPRGAPCSHCVGRRPSPPATKSDWQPGPAGKADGDSAPQVGARLPAFSRAFVREVIPAQHAPPPKPGRHLLLGVFLI